MAAAVIILFIVLLLIGVPVGAAMGIPAFLYFIINGISLSTIPYTFYTNLMSFSMLSIPLFILFGLLVNEFGETDRAFEFARRLMKGQKGYSAKVNVIISLLFAGMSGAAIADVGGLGAVEIKAMEEEGYSRAHASALTIATATVGPIFPPSIPLLLYCTVAATSSIKQLISGCIPAVILSACLFVYVCLTTKKKIVNPPHHGFFDEKDKVPMSKVALDALPIVIAPVLIIYFMLSGKFTPGETGAAACIYIIILAIFHKSFSFKKLYNASMETLKSCGTMMIMSVTGVLFSTVMGLEKVPAKLIMLLGPVAENKIAVLILVNVVLLFLGMLMESNAAMFMIAPIILAITTPLGIDPIQMGVIIVYNLMIGLSTPPYGLCIFTVAKVGRVDPGAVIREVMPMWIPMLITLLAVTFIPQVTLWLPTVLFG